MSHSDYRTKKRKLGHNGAADDVNTSKPSARFNPSQGGRDWTISVAIPGSIVADHRTLDQRMTSPGRIARALAVFSVDEVVVYNDMPSPSHSSDLQTSASSFYRTQRPSHQGHQGHHPRQRPGQRHQNNNDSDAGADSSFTADVDPCHFLAHLLSYLEAPPFMRKTLFPIHPNLRLAGLLPSLDMPHHPNPIDTAIPYREGVTLDRPPPATDSDAACLVDMGAKSPVSLPDAIPPNTRVTLRFPSGSFEHGPAEAVHPATPREEGGYYWGYAVRRASSLSAVFEESPFEGGYDVSIGTSERGDSVSRAFPRHDRALPFKHLLIVFGGPRGIEFAAANDPQLSELGVGGGATRELFDHWIDVLPNQGSRTIRTDEAVFIALTALRRLWDLS
ncbi:deoxyribose-phosphate aldolase 2 [Sodiomyces alkalinus F11]|uniref:Deoxyribose-phosphate aldolase 2 n=1 Tax=Sodiomyces alkalinus (strain CBS 110278 / VKM F-3762 / F11) TaxID=1314773 RepID=A0A3N2Q2U6_SODAK|nr:deoxyribose-phosphate aldolase 2 [Sodiomyces alkalinus F11]ROT41091.1 deoxyribose-phosphate aldolase 2 [Sodiomyces alkalinus F11]